MTIGPSLTGAVLEPPATGATASAEEAIGVQKAIATKLGEILEELRRGRDNLV
jgi:hypothetical protein